MRPVYVLGAGPSGLVAAWAAARAGHPIAILSRGAVKSEIHGCQYLHREIPGIGQHDTTVRIETRGEAEDYASKVYGPQYQGHVSFSDYAGSPTVVAYDLREMYDRLWNLFGPEVQAINFNPQTLPYWTTSLGDDAIVISTIPALALCANEEHLWRSQSVWAIGQTPDSPPPFTTQSDNTIIYDGTRDSGWYRLSQVFGRTTIEWPFRDGQKPPISGVVRVEKPLGTNCDCHPGIYRAGRFGEWKKGRLVHHVYDLVEDLLIRIRDKGEQGRLF